MKLHTINNDDCGSNLLPLDGGELPLSNARKKFEIGVSPTKKISSAEVSTTNFTHLLKTFVIGSLSAMKAD